MSTIEEKNYLRQLANRVSEIADLPIRKNAERFGSVTMPWKRSVLSFSFSPKVPGEPFCPKINGCVRIPSCEASNGS
jgi:hypothetical protein